LIAIDVFTKVIHMDNAVLPARNWTEVGMVNYYMVIRQ
jgi:hypothetical protein